MDDAVLALGKGSRVWYKKDKETWLLAEIRDGGSGGATSVQLLTGSPGKVLSVEPGLLVPANPVLQQGIADLTQLSYLNEPSILDNLAQRYDGDAIYTNAGPVLIAVNPCKALPLYTSDMAKQYKAGAFEAVNQLGPHIYLVAGAAFRDMVRQGASQSLVINGESGAGKTETTKKAMQFFAALAGGTGVEDQVLETNPILEAFGNAKTLRNHNSSRFGKLIEIHFNTTNHICGARIRTYLLEKSRVVHQLKGERSYHIFYQLVRGTRDKAQRAALRLPAKPTDFAYLAKSGCVDIDGVDDAANFEEVCCALGDIGVSDEDLAGLLAALSGILWLGNLRVESAAGDEASRIKADAALSNAASLLGFDEKVLAHALTHKKIRTRDELIVKPLKPAEAVDARDALAKALYSGVFNWVVTAINAKLDMGKRASGRFIAILDIYGFEQFTTNSFEQLCINYANERLQQQFTRHLFTLEQEEYESEGIDWTKVEWVDNQACVDTIEAMPPKGLGVLAVLDAQCRFPAGSDATFLHALRDALAGNDHFGTNARKQDEFFVNHYAGPVSYSAAGFLEKNKDMLNADLLELMCGSSTGLVSGIGASTSEEMEGKRGGQTVSSRFTGQLRELVAMLDTTGLHFVRCIKPNGSLAPSKFATELVLQQLRCCGVLEVARVSRAGFPTRYRHADFVERYKILLPREQQGLVLASDAQARAAVLQLLTVFKVPQGQFEMGRTKVFFKPGVLGYVEDTWAKMQSSVLKLQAFGRMYLARRRFKAVQAAALFLQSGWRARAVRAVFAEQLKQHRAAVTIQRRYKGFTAAQAYQQTRAAIVTLQTAERRRQLNMRVAKRVQERQAREAAEAAVAEQRRLAEEGFDTLKRQYGITELSEVRSALACYAALKGELGSRDPEEVTTALALLAAVRRAPGIGADADPSQLAAALQLSAVAHEQLGPGVDAAQLQQALAGAALCSKQLGGPEQLQPALAVAAVCQQELGSLDTAQLQQALSVAAVCRQELGPDANQQQLQQALAAAAVCRRELGSCEEEEVQQALAAAAACKEQLGHSGPQELLLALSAAAMCKQRMGRHDKDQLQQSLAVAELVQQELGSADEQELQQALQAAVLCKQQLGSLEQQQLQQALLLAATATDNGAADQQSLSEALAAAAVCKQQLGSLEQQQLQQALLLAATATDNGAADQQSLSKALAAAAVCRQQLGSCEEEEVQQALAAAAACKEQLGHSGPQELLLALSAAAMCKQRMGRHDKDQLQQSLAVAELVQQELGSADEQELQQALQAAMLCKQQLGSLEQQQLQQALLLAATATDNGAADQQSLSEALAAAAVCKQQLGSLEQQQLQQALLLAATATANGAADQQSLSEALAAAAVCRQQLGSLEQQQLQQALAAAAVCRQQLGGYDERELQQSCQLAAAAKQQLGGDADQQQVQELLQLGLSCQQAGVKRPAQLQQQLKLAAAAAPVGAAPLVTPEDVAAALALHQAADGASAEQVAAALKLQAAAEDEGISNAAGLTAALAAAAAAAAATATAAAAASHSSREPSGEESLHASLGSVAAAQGVTEPDELAAALSTYRHLRRDGHAFDPKHARRACSMYAAAIAQGIADKRDFMAAAALYGVLRDDGITSANELRLAVAMYGAVREEGIVDPEDLHAAIALACAARDEGLGDAGELADVLAASRGAPRRRESSSSPAAGAASSNGHHQRQLGGLRASVAGEGGSGGDAALVRQVELLTVQLESERATRAKYAKQLEQQAVEWMGQVKLLKEYIDSLRAKMPAAGGPAMPALSLPAGAASSRGGGAGGGGGGGAEAGVVRGLESELAAKGPLFEDDAAFIREVLEGKELAPDMQVQAELDRLRRKHEQWNKQFKDRMRETQAALRKRQQAAGSTSLTANSRAGSMAAAGGGVPAPAAHVQLASESSAAVDVRKMPDLTKADLLSSSEDGSLVSPSGSGGGGGGGEAKKKKGGFFKGLGLGK